MVGRLPAACLCRHGRQSSAALGSTGARGEVPSAARMPPFLTPFNRRACESARGLAPACAAHQVSSGAAGRQSKSWRALGSAWNSWAMALDGGSALPEWVIFMRSGIRGNQPTAAQLRRFWSGFERELGEEEGIGAERTAGRSTAMELLGGGVEGRTLNDRDSMLRIGGAEILGALRGANDAPGLAGAGE